MHARAISATLLLIIHAASAYQLQLQGAGSTLAYNLYTSAAMAYGFVRPNVSVEYFGFGSGRGNCRIEDAAKECQATDTTPPLAIDFGGSDSLLTNDDYRKYPDLQMYPTVASAVVPILNLGATADVLLSAVMLAQIFRGAIIAWDDPAIVQLNGNVTEKWGVPAGQRITVVVRSDVSGTTQIFKKSLAAFEDAFKQQVGTDSAASWPNVTTIMQPGTQGTVSYVLNTPFTISYSEYGTALLTNVTMVRLQKASGAVLSPSVEGIEFSVLQLGLSFGNNGDDPERLTADIQNADGANAWPIVGYTYLVMRKSTLRPGATCTSVWETMVFWNWFWTSDVVGGMVVREGFSALPEIVRDAVLARFLDDIRCEGHVVWKSPEPTVVTGLAPAATAGFITSVTTVYQVVRPDVQLQITLKDEATDVNTALNSFAFTATFEAPASVAGGVHFLFAGSAFVAITQLQVALDGPTLAQILDGTVTSWLDPAIVALNPAGVLTAGGDPLAAAPAPAIRLLRGPSATTPEFVAMMQRYLPGYSGGALASAAYLPSEDTLRYVVLGQPHALAISAFTGAFPAGLLMVPIRNAAQAYVAPSWQAIQACASADVYDPSVNTFRLPESQAHGCYPLAAPVHVSVRKSQCDVATDAERTEAVALVEWLMGSQALYGALTAALLAPLYNATPEVAAQNALATSAVTCQPTPVDYVPFIAGGSAGGAALLVTLLLSNFLFLLCKQQRNNARAPKDASKPFCVVFTDIQSSSYLWATVPAEMATALDTHHTLIRKLIAKHGLYEVKTIGDSFMCVTPEPKNAVAFALALQQEFFEHAWDPEIDQRYREQQRSQLSELPASVASSKGTDGGTEVKMRIYREMWNGLRVRVGLHYGRGEIKLDPVSQGYDYYGHAVNVAARIESVCHGGQIGVSDAVYAALKGHFPAAELTDLGSHLLRGLNEQVHIYQLLPAGPLATRRFPRLRLDHFILHAQELPDDTETGSASEASGLAVSVDLAYHPLVTQGEASADDLTRLYHSAMATLQTLLATQTVDFKKSTLRTICQRLKVRNAGSNGRCLQQTLHGLVLRVLPAVLRAQPERRRCSATSMVSDSLRGPPAPEAPSTPTRPRSPHLSTGAREADLPGMLAEDV